MSDDKIKVDIAHGHSYNLRYEHTPSGGGARETVGVRYRNKDSLIKRLIEFESNPDVTNVVVVEHTVWDARSMYTEKMLYSIKKKAREQP